MWRWRQTTFLSSPSALVPGVLQNPSCCPPAHPALIPSVSSWLYLFSSHPETQSASLPPTRLPHLSLFSFFHLYTAIFPLLNVLLPSSSRLILSLGQLAPLRKGKRSWNQTSEMSGRVISSVVTFDHFDLVTGWGTVIWNVPQPYWYSCSWKHRWSAFFMRWGDPPETHGWLGRASY